MDAAGTGVTDQSHWGRLTSVFDRMLESADPESLLEAEPDPLVRAAARKLWAHHVRAEAENYLGAPMEFEVAPVFLQGERLLNRFRIETMLGSGGMGEVYLVWDERLEARVALKTMARLLAPSASIRRRFIAEVQNARRVTHPNVCRIHELFEVGDRVFFSMEFVEGVLLSETPKERFSTRQARNLIRQLAEALHSAHQTGVVHGDLKPANIMMVGNGDPADPKLRPVVMDFGLARAVDRALIPEVEGLSLRGGTADYMAPELRHGGSPTIASDIFAFGMVARELLPGARLWDECTRPLPKDRPVSLASIIRRMEPGNSRRYWLGALAMASVGVARHAFRPARSTPAALPANARILVNGFRSVASEIPGAKLARSLVLTALQQSPRIHPIADEDLLPALRHLQPEGGLPVAGGVLNAVLQQLRAAFWIDGDLRKAGERYSLDLRLMSLSGPQVVAASVFQDEPSVTALARAAAVWVRKTAGESRQSLAANSADVVSYTSTVPEALQKYYEAMEYYALGQMSQAVPLLQEAVRLDPGFVQAHSTLGMSLNPVRQYEEGFREVNLAFGMSGKLPERERVAIEASYYRLTEDPFKMVATAKQNVAYHPDEPRCYNVLGQALTNSGEISDGVLAYRKAVSLAPDDWAPIERLEAALVQAGRFDEALNEFKVALSRGVTNKWIYNGAACAYMGLERYEEAVQAFAAEPADYGNSADIQSAKIMQGHLEVAIAAMEEQRAAARSLIQACPENQFLCALYYVIGRTESALKPLREMADLPLYPPMAGKLAWAASWARRLHDERTLAAVRESVATIARGWPNPHTQAVEMHATALQLWQSGQSDDAERLLLKASGTAFGVWSVFDLAEFYTQQGKWELAEAYWQKFEACHGTVIVKGWFPGLLVLGWLYRATAAQARNDRAAAFRYSQKVLDHWSGTNPRLQAVQAARSINLVSKPL